MVWSGVVWCEGGGEGWNSVECSVVEWSGVVSGVVVWSGVEWGGVEWSGVEGLAV